jgi:hypothetical protein
VLLVLLAASPAVAATLVGLGGSRLIRAAEAAVVGRVVEIGSRGDRIETLVGLVVEEVLRGTEVPPLLWVRLPGGVRGERARVVAGAPRVRLGDRVLVLLARTAGGWLSPLGLGRGWYRLEERHARRVVAGAARVVAREAGTRRRASLARLRARLAEGGRGIAVGAAAAETAARLTPPGGVTPAPAYGLLHARWFEPDSGAPVGFVVDARGDRRLGPLPALEAVELRMDLVSRPGRAPGARSVILFNDPYGELPVPRRCRGILAVGGFEADVGGAATIDGVRFARITAGEVTVANGFGRCRFWRRVNLAEVMTHELGHALGLGHSEVPEAAMFPRAHLDGRGATLAADDAEALAALYPLPAGAGADGDRDGVPDETDRCPAAADADQMDDDGDGVGDRCDACPTAGAACAPLRLQRLVLRYGGGGLRLRALVPPAALDEARTLIRWSGGSAGAPSLRLGSTQISGPALRAAAHRRGDGWHLVLRARGVPITPAAALAVAVRIGGRELGTLAPCAAGGRFRLECPPRARLTPSSRAR